MTRFFNFNSSLFILYIAAYILLPSCFVYMNLNDPSIGTDDSNILFEYSRNFANGHGIVYNIGGEHVEGFSCMLYFLICSFFYMFTGSPETIILVFNLFISALSGIFILYVLKRLTEHFKTPAIHLHILCWIYLIWLFMNPLYFGWTVVSLMDSGIYSFLLITAYSYLIITYLNNRIEKKQKRRVSFLVFLIILARPEGIIWGGVFVFIYFLLHLRNTTFIEAVKNSLAPLLSYLTTLVLLVLFRMSYFGYPLPNTYYTKVSASFTATIKDGWAYFSEFTGMYGALILVLIFLLFVWTAWSLFIKKDKSDLFYISLITLIFVGVGLTLPILEGGDHFKGFRFYQNIYPLLIIPFILLLFIFKQVERFSICMITAGIVIASLFYFNEAGWKKFITNNNYDYVMEDVRVCISMEFNIAKRSRENGERLNDVFKDQLPIIGYGSAGGIAYGYEGTVYDMMGLNNTKLAHADAIKSGPKGHQSFNQKVFFELAPDILMPTTEPANAPVILSQANDYYTNVNGWDNLIFKNLFNAEEFKKKYTLALVLNTQHPDYLCYGYFNNNYLKTISDTGKFKIQVFNN